MRTYNYLTRVTKITESKHQICVNVAVASSLLPPNWFDIQHLAWLPKHTDTTSFYSKGTNLLLNTDYSVSHVCLIKRMSTKTPVYA